MSERPKEGPVFERLQEMAAAAKLIAVAMGCPPEKAARDIERLMDMAWQCAEGEMSEDELMRQSRALGFKAGAS